MVSFLLKILFLTIFSSFVIHTYYFEFDFHQVGFTSGIVGYLISVIFFYLLYKLYNYIIGEKEIKISPIGLFGYFLINLVVVSIMFFTLNGNDLGEGFNLFLKIIIYMIVPIILTYISLGFGYYIVNKIPNSDKETKIFRFLMSLGLGFVVFISLLSIFGFFGLYNLTTVGILLLVLAGISYKEQLLLIKNSYNYKITYSDHDFKSTNLLERLNLKGITGEIFFIILTFVLSVNIVNIVRPMPIGWDDMGVYMNYPQLMANAGEILNLGGSLSWSVFTGIGYMFQSATQAFFINNLGGILSVIVLILAFYDLIGKVSKKSFINISIFIGTIFASMPMVIFQQAKDQKQDPGLFFLSAIAIYLVLYIFLKYIGYKRIYKGEGFEISEEQTPNSSSFNLKYDNKDKENIFFAHFKKYTNIGKSDLFKKKEYLIYIFIIGLILGFTFSIKVTSLLLISGIFAIIFYAKLGIAGLFGYLSLYIGIFTYLGLWDLMNVIYPADDNSFRLNTLIYLGILSIGLFIYSIYKYSFASLKGTIILLLILKLGILTSMSPRLSKNIISLDGEINSIGAILNGKRDSFRVDYSKIYSPEELEEIESNKEQTGSRGITETGTTINEDFGRYFGYEAGINNYVKLPYNLTMQVNQRGEYTDITYLYFAFIPAILLFLAYKAPIFAIGTFIMSLIPLGFFFNNNINAYISNILSNFTLPFGYIIFSLFFIIPFLYLIYTLNKEKLSVLFKINLVFASFYIFLWSISSFGIVWYGIAMYFSLLLIIGIGISYISNYDDNESSKILIGKLLGSGIVFIIVMIYFIISTIPHGLNNLKSSGYATFKAGEVNRYVGIFESQPHYFDILLGLNISKNVLENNILFKKINNKSSNEMKFLINDNNVYDIIGLESFLRQVEAISNNSNDLKAQVLSREARNLRSDIYSNVLYPSDEIKNESKVYRIGTFMSYFITNSYNRMFSDNLLNNFDTYYFDEEDINKAPDRMKDLGIDYLISDLNAATIDRDERRDLTRRYENLLKTFTSDKLELVGSDSLCLKTGLESYKNGLISLDEYMLIAGVNYESYKNGELTYHRGEKQIICYNHMLELMNEGNINEKDYNYLLPHLNAINNMGELNDEILINFFRQNVRHGWMTVFRIN